LSPYHKSLDYVILILYSFMWSKCILFFKVTLHLPSFGIVFQGKTTWEMSVSQVCGVVCNGYTVG
jgi:hypothetical protein